MPITLLMLKLFLDDSHGDTEGTKDAEKIYFSIKIYDGRIVVFRSL